MHHQCLKCKKPAVTYIRYNGTHLCADHFNTYFEKRVKKEIKKQGKLPAKGTIGVAVSGGKDSIVALSFLHHLVSERKNLQIHAITIDEGIQGYRNKSIEIARDFCLKQDIPHHIVSFRKFIGKTMDEIAQQNNKVGECTFCGVFRRFCLNTEAKHHHLLRLVTGHNLDDMAQSILMNFINSDLQKLARLGPHHKVQPGLIPRMMPLRSIPEKEIMLYALINNIPFHNAECPYAPHAFRGKFRDILDLLEDKNPGTKHSILNSYDALKEHLLTLYPPISLNTCTLCNEPTSQTLCKTCILKEKIQQS